MYTAHPIRRALIHFAIKCEQNNSFTYRRAQIMMRAGQTQHTKKVFIHLRHNHAHLNSLWGTRRAGGRPAGRAGRSHWRAPTRARCRRRSPSPHSDRRRSPPRSGSDRCAPPTSAAATSPKGPTPARGTTPHALTTRPRPGKKRRKQYRRSLNRVHAF
jgi:hypothetical protein